MAEQYTGTSRDSSEISEKSSNNSRINVNCNDKERKMEENTPGGEASAEEDVLDLAFRAGNILVENGAEISRVEETIERICSHFNVHTEHAYVLSNGIFLTAGLNRQKDYAAVRYIPVKGTRYDRVIEVNQLSREIEEGRCTIAQARERLDQIETMHGKSDRAQIIGSGIASAAFCVLFGGSLTDALCALPAGLVLYIFVLKASTARKSKMLQNVLGGMIVTAICYLLYYFGAGKDLHDMIIGALMPLIPGVAFINGIRDMAEGDYLSGAVRMLDALLVFASISIGVGSITMLFYALTGGRPL